MSGQIVISVIARDRPGLVEMISGLVTRNGGNWLESRMSRLGGQFAGIVRLAVPADGREALVSQLQELSKSGIRVQVQTDETDSRDLPARLAEFRLIGQDRPGIIMHISEVFARYGVNVEDLNTQISSAPMTGELLFEARATVRIPQDCPVAEMKAALEKIAADLMVDATFQEVASEPPPSK